MIPEQSRPLDEPIEQIEAAPASRRRFLGLLVGGALTALGSRLRTAQAMEGPDLPMNYVAGDLIQLNDNGAWSWFTDERVIVDEDKLIVGSVRGAASQSGNDNNPDWGNVEVAVYNLSSGEIGKTVLDQHFEHDDHDDPAFLTLPDGRYLATYTKHGAERRIYSRFSEPHNPLAWGPVYKFETPGTDGPPLTGDNVTYSNLFCLPSGRIMNFFRGFQHDPNYIYSDDSATTWKYGGRLLQGRGGYSPYLKYAFDGQDAIHFVVTDDHPRNYDNSVYHGIIRDGNIYFADGTLRGKLSENTDTDISAWDMTQIFKGDADHVAWVTDLELDKEQNPYLVFSVQRDGHGLPRGQGGMDHRFYYGRWDGLDWRVNEIAYAGARLYAGEDDYTGLAALNPNNPDVIYISTDADPASGEPLMSHADGIRHHELYRGTTGDSGQAWRWEPITANSTVDNLRPIVPKWKDPRTALVWMRGGYHTNFGSWTSAVVTTILPPNPSKTLPKSNNHM